MITTRQFFDQSLEALKSELLQMGSLVEKAVGQAVESLVRQEVTLAQRVIDGDDAVDEMELAIEDRCMKLIATQQPMGRDLRRIGIALKIIVDLERMADYATDIARVTLRLAGQPFIKPLVDIPRMARIAGNMVRGVLEAYVREDPVLAEKASQADDEVDHLYSQIFRELLTYMMEDPRNITQATYLLFVGRYLERVADHATNIGERVIYLATGERKDLNV